MSVALQWCALPLAAQWQSNTGPAGAALGAVVGGDVERYVRALAMAGIIKPVAWGARPFGAQDLSDLLRDSTFAEHPWRAALESATGKGASLGGMVFSSFNSGFPWGANDGAMWQGRGITASLGGAATVAWGPIEAVAAPVFFSSQNASFPLQLQPLPNISPFADPLLARGIDLPQRMGPTSYTRFDAGESRVQISLHHVTVGISTASMGWGTGEAFPAIFGANAGGFPHILAGTRGRGLRVPSVGRVNALYVLGVLDQSPWSPVAGSKTFVDVAQPGTRRIGSGLHITFMPDFLPGLELGASRFYHSPYRNAADRWKAWSKPFEGIFKQSFSNRIGGPGDPNGDADNQLAALSARWVIPNRGVEANFELLREDHSWDSRDLAEEPENNSAVMASIRAITERSAGRLSAITFEYFDGNVRPIAQARGQGAIYVHTVLTQGHTQRGQLLGSPIGAGAITGERVAWERFTPVGSYRFNLQRWTNRSARPTGPEGLYPSADSAITRNHDWILDGSILATRYRSTRALSAEIGIAWAGVWQMSSSRTNLYARASWSAF